MSDGAIEAARARRVERRVADGHARPDGVVGRVLARDLRGYRLRRAARMVQGASRRAGGRWRAHALLIRRRASRARGLCRDPSRDWLARSTLRASQPLWRGRRAGVDRSGAPSVAGRHPARRERRQSPRPTLLRARRLLPRWRWSHQLLRSSHCRFGMASKLSGGCKIKSGLCLGVLPPGMLSADFGLASPF